MAATLTDAKRTAIAEKLADMKAVQNLLISNERQFLEECKDQDLRERLEDMLEDDQKNLGIIETTIVQYGVQAKPKEEVEHMVQQFEKKMGDTRATLYEKMVQHELLKHGQVMSGLVVHKAAQIVGADVKESLAPLNTVNFENRAHQEQLKGVLEYWGPYELTGEAPDQSLGARFQDAIAALTGIVGSATTQTSDQSDLDIMQIIFMDHQKAKTLIREIEKTEDVQKAQEYFGQLFQDLTVHSKAEEAIVYPAVRSFYGESDTQELYDEQAELEQVLKRMKTLSPISEEFKTDLKQVKSMVGDHTRQEESTLFASMRKNLSDDQREQMASQFKDKKKELQMQM
ncbi:MAG: hemerythrin domain-containing protein [Scytolyngbya sp. HA4215-MV1]|jgi:hemerythrin superfamily protein|nr:hemerythrin domain-containing protein [Scytolyngbya sp. HA4215-MV1]